MCRVEKYVFRKPTLVMGVDVSHPTLQEAESNLPSVAAIVGSTDMYAMQFGASVKVPSSSSHPLPSAVAEPAVWVQVQRGAQEHVIYLVDQMKERLVAFYKATNKQPDHILIYRDGPSAFFPLWSLPDAVLHLKACPTGSSRPSCGNLFPQTG